MFRYTGPLASGSSPLPAATPRICCLDLDTFFVSVERTLDASLEGKPVIVGGRPGQRGVVTACSYEVREFGVRSGMSLTQAAQLAPRAIFLPVRHGTYGDYAKRVVHIAERFSPVIRVASIDEMFIDFRGSERLYHAPDDATDDETIERVVWQLTDAIAGELGLPSSAGIATSKVIAKVASGLAKPRGVLMVPAGQETELLAPLPVRKFPGIGPVAAKKLEAAGILTLGQLADMPYNKLTHVFGAWTGNVYRGVHGHGSADMGPARRAFREHDPSGETVGSISNERTFREDEGDPTVLDSMLCALCERVSWRARKRGVKARTVTLKLRYADFVTLSRSKTTSPTHSEKHVLGIVRELYRRANTTTGKIRLLGVALTNLGPGEQLNLFENQDRLHTVVDHVRARFGFDAVRLAAASTREVDQGNGHGEHRTWGGKGTHDTTTRADPTTDPTTPP
ncbi:MAG: DNA polymerase IV [Nannocystaceae bacterium]